MQSIQYTSTYKVNCNCTIKIRKKKKTRENGKLFSYLFNFTNITKI